MQFGKNFSFLFVVALFLTACGSEHVNLDEVMVPLYTSEDPNFSEDDGDAREPATVLPAPEDNPMVSLRTSVLANSDIAPRALDNAIAYYNANQSKIRNKNYMTIFDIGLHSGKRRFYMINLKTGAVTTMHVAHGSGSDPDHDGIATKFSNVSGSHMSSLGFMLTAEEYVGKHGGSMRLDGLEARNSKVRARAIVVHSASYVDPSLSKMGRSQGCPAVPLANIKSVVANLKNGSLFYIFHAAYD